MKLDTKAFFEACRGDSDLMAFIAICMMATVISVTKSFFLAAGMAAVFAIIWILIRSALLRVRIKEEAAGIRRKTGHLSKDVIDTCATNNERSELEMGHGKDHHDG